MESKNIRQLGVSWGKNSLYVVETLDTVPEKIFHIPFEERTQAPIRADILDDWENELVRKIKDTFKEQKVTSTNINLSLPTSDIIFRSFIIPWMQKSEAKNVVEFEACKYTPFALEELSYSYHPITVNEDGKKYIHIIFVAIRNDALANYIKIFEAASLNVGVIEPSALSLIRTLSFKELIPEDQTIALIEKEETGKIIVSDKNIPQFAREFNLSSTTSEQDLSDPEDTTKNLTNEVRISLDFFNRQSEQLKVEKIFFLSSSDDKDLLKNLENQLGIPAVAIKIASVLDDDSQLEVGALNAYGASLIPFVSTLVSFNLSKSKSDSIKKEPLSFSFSFKEITSHQLLVFTLWICIPLIIGSIALSIYWPYQVKKEIKFLKQRLGSFQDTEISFIGKKEELVKNKLTVLQNTRLKSDSALFLLLIPNLLPEGTWLKALDISYYDAIDLEITSRRRGQVTRVNKATKNETKPLLAVVLEGYAFSLNKGEQFRLVNILLGKLKSSAEFSKFFKRIEIEKVSAQKLNNYDVTYFKIICEQTNENIRPQ